MLIQTNISSFLRCVLGMLLLLVCDYLVAQSEHSITFITDDMADSVQVNWLESKGFVLNTWWPGDVNNLTSGERAMLNEADLVIIGRSPGSVDLASMKVSLNNINAPVMNCSPFGVRNTRLNWFNVDHVDRYDTDPPIFKAHIENPEDEIFDGISLSNGDSLELFNAPHDLLNFDLSSVQTNAEIVASNESLDIVAIARFTPDVEFYEGSVDKPLGYFTYFGFGNDQFYASGLADTINFFPLTSQGKKVYYNEIVRLIRLGNTGLEPESDIAILSELDYDGNSILKVDVYDYTVTLPQGTTTVPTVTYTTADQNSTVKVSVASSLPGETTIVVTAPDGVTTVTYTIDFKVLKEGPTVLFVGQNGNLNDEMLIDSLSNNLGYNVVLVEGTVFDSDFTEATAYDGYDVVFISESIASGNADAYGFAGMPIPCLLAEPYALNKEGIMFGSVSYDGAPGLMGAFTAQQDVLPRMIIEDVDHPITREEYESGMIVQVLNDAPTEMVWQYEMILEPALLHTVLGAPDLSDATNPADWQGPSWIVVNGGQTFTTTLPSDAVSIFVPSGVEVVVHAFHGTAPSQATPEYFKQIRRSIQYLVGDLEVADPASSADLLEVLVNGKPIKGFESDKHAYITTLPAGTISPTVTATAVNPNATITITFPEEVPGRATIEVISEDQSATKVYEIDFEYESANLYDVLFVGNFGASTEINDLLVIDSLEAWGYSVKPVTGSEYSEEDHSEYGIVYISESISSSSAEYYGASGFPIPAFISEPYALSKSSISLGGLTGSEQQEILESMVIEDVDHPITRGIYASGQSVQIFQQGINGWENNIFQYEFIVNNDVDYTVLGRPDLTFSFDPGIYAGAPSWVVIEDFTANVNDVEIVVHAFHDGAAITGTNEYWSQVKSSINYLIGKVSGCVNRPTPPKGETEQVFCSTVNLSDLIVSGVGIRWYDSAQDGTALDLSQSVVDGQAYYASQVIDGCESGTRLGIQVIVEEPTIAASNLEITQGEEITLEVQSMSGAVLDESLYQIEWSNGATGSIISVSPTQTTTYTVKITRNNFTCENEVTITVSTSLLNISDVDWKVYPSLVNGKLTVDVNVEGGSLTVMDIQGMILRNLQLNHKRTVIDVDDMRAGLYLVQLKVGGKVHQAKFLKE